jgi:hypothetical protein
MNSCLWSDLPEVEVAPNNLRRSVSGTGSASTSSDECVGIRAGWPWTEEMIAVAYKHPKVFISSDAYAPSHWFKELVRYIESWGSAVRHRFSGPRPERAHTEIDEVHLATSP